MTGNLAPVLELVQGQPRASSLQIAEHFRKRHKDVLRAITLAKGNLPEDFTERNFAPSEFTDSTGRRLPTILLTRDGFMLVVMGFTGKEAMLAKVAFIEAFNRMEAELRGQALPTGSISPDQQQHIRNLVAARAKALPHGGGFPQIWERVKNRFGVARYQDIPAAQFEAVVEYLLKLEVKQEPKALAPSALALGSFDMLTVSPESAAFEHDRDAFTRACHNALTEKRFALKQARFGGKNQRAAAEMLLQEIRLLEIQYEAATSSAHAFAHTLYQADRLTKIAGVL